MVQSSSMLNQTHEINDPNYSRHDLCVVYQVLQWIAAGEVIVEVCGVADHPLVRSGCVNEASDDDWLDA